MGNNNDKIKCKKCEKMIIPKMVFKKGEPKKSVCVFCGATVWKRSLFSKIDWW